MLYFCKNFKKCHNSQKMSQFTENVAKYGSRAISLFFNSQGGRSPSFEVFKLDMYVYHRIKMLNSALNFIGRKRRYEKNNIKVEDMKSHNAIICWFKYNNSTYSWFLDFSCPLKLDRSCPNGTNTPHPNICNLLESLSIQKFSFFKSRPKFEIKVRGSKTLVRTERSCHKEYPCVIWKIYIFQFKIDCQVLVFFKSR